MDVLGESSMVRLKAYPTGDEPECDGVKHRSQHFGTLVAERSLNARRLFRNPHGDQCHPYGEGVREHVASVGYESQATRKYASDDLGQHVGRDQRQGDYEVLATSAPQVVGMVVASMAMIVVTSVVMVIVFVAFVVTADEAVVIAGVRAAATN